MKVLMLAVQLLFSTYDYSFEYGTEVVIEAIGFALNEASCLNKPDLQSPSCVAYCYTNLEWVGLHELNPICHGVLDIRGDHHGEILSGE